VTPASLKRLSPLLGKADGAIRPLLPVRLRSSSSFPLHSVRALLGIDQRTVQRTMSDWAGRM
jgi:hypothetical protein